MNMQTSFLTPPFGFALFYLRSVAAKVPYLDKITGRNIEGIKTSEIYKGAIPFIFVQVIMIFVVVLWPLIGDALQDARSSTPRRSRSRSPR